MSLGTIIAIIIGGLLGIIAGLATGVFQAISDRYFNGNRKLALLVLGAALLGIIILYNVLSGIIG